MRGIGYQFTGKWSSGSRLEPARGVTKEVAGVRLGECGKHGMIVA